MTPTSKVVGDLALYLLSAGIDPADLEEDPSSYDLPDGVLGFLRGDLGPPPGGWPEPFRSLVLAGRGGPPANDGLSAEDLRALGGPDRRGVLDRLLFPGPTGEQSAAKERYGDVSVLPTKAFLYGLEIGEELAVDLEPGVRIYVRLEAVTQPDERGARTLLVTLNGQSRPVDAQDRSVEPEVSARERADPGERGHVAAPMSGVATLSVGEGEEVEAGQQIATIEAMKMESAVQAPFGGAVRRTAIPTGTNVEPGDLLVVLEEGIE